MGSGRAAGNPRSFAILTLYGTMPRMPTAKLVIRPARSGDRDQAFAISTQIWDGDDYVPEVWDEWLAEPGGAFVVAVLRGRVAGFAKLTQYGPGEWWLQGLRVAPRYRGRGIARAMHDHLLALAGEVGPGKVRYATGGDNLASQHLGQTSGFEVVNHYVRLQAPALTRAESSALDLPALVVWRKADLADLAAFVRRSAYLRANRGLYAAHWTWYELTPGRLAGHIAARQAYGWRDARGRVAALALVESSNDDDRLRVHFAEARLSGPLGLTALGRALRGLARRRRCKAVALEVPVGSAWQRALGKAGFALGWDHTVAVLERPVP